MKTPLSGAPAAGSGCCWERLRSPLLQEKQRGRYFIRCYLLDLSYTDLVSPTGYGRQACCSHPLPPGAEGALEGKLPRCPSARGAGGRRGAFPPPPRPPRGGARGTRGSGGPKAGGFPMSRTLRDRGILPWGRTTRCLQPNELMPGGSKFLPSGFGVWFGLGFFFPPLVSALEPPHARPRGPHAEHANRPRARPLRAPRCRRLWDAVRGPGSLRGQEPPRSRLDGGELRAPGALPPPPPPWRGFG